MSISHGRLNDSMFNMSAFSHVNAPLTAKILKQSYQYHEAGIF